MVDQPNRTRTRTTLHFGENQQQVLVREVLNIERDDGTAQFRIRLDEIAPLAGYGRTRREAALHLAHQLSQLAQAVGSCEGTTKPGPTPEQDLKHARVATGLRKP